MAFHPLVVIALLGRLLLVEDGENRAGFPTMEACTARLAELKVLIPPFVLQRLGLPAETEIKTEDAQCVQIETKPEDKDTI